MSSQYPNFSLTAIVFTIIFFHISSVSNRYISTPELKRTFNKSMSKTSEKLLKTYSKEKGNTWCQMIFDSKDGFSKGIREEATLISGFEPLMVQSLICDISFPDDPEDSSTEDSSREDRPIEGALPEDRPTGDSSPEDRLTENVSPEDDNLYVIPLRNELHMFSLKYENELEKLVYGGTIPVPEGVAYARYPFVGKNPHD